jgi:FKBP-type peptidyl-prolyl cis-trans isomerase FklB
MKAAAGAPITSLQCGFVIVTRMNKQTRTLILGTCGLLALTGGTLSPAGAQTPAAATAPAGPTADEAGYAYGVNFGMQLANLGLGTEVPPESVMRGLKDGMAGKKSTMADINTVKAFASARAAAVVAKNSAAARDFLDHNAGQKGVKSTQSGLQYKILAAGDHKGSSPRATDAVTVRYRGRLIDGSEFDSSYAHGNAATFPVSNMIKGWQEALELMKPGAKWQIFVPPDLAYGDASQPHIPAGSLLIFDLELVNVTPSAAANMPNTAIN